MTDFLDFVENRLSADPDDRPLRGAVTSFIGSCEVHGCVDISEDTLRRWVASMMLDGLKPGTRRKYLGIIRSLYKDWGADAGRDRAFEAVRDLAGADVQDVFQRAESNLHLVRRLLLRDWGTRSDETVSIFLYLLFNVGAELSDGISLKFGDPYPILPQLDDIVDAMRASARKKYVFGLGQGKKRNGQILRDLLHSISATLRASGLDLASGFSRDSITALWITAALRAGISAPVIRTMTENSIPKEFSHLKYIEPAELDSYARLEVMRRVADSIHDGTSRWFIMKMRPGNAPADIRAAIQAADNRLYGEMSFYYPSRTIITVDRNGRKRKEEQPYLPRILFFRVRHDRVAGLFRRIGELAWCYRRVNSPDSPYCTVPPAEMMAFQRCVGSFTSDIRMELRSLDAPPLSAGQRVRITGGMLGDQIGIIRSVRNTDGSRTYTVALSCHDFVTWTVSGLDEACLQPVGT